MLNTLMSTGGMVTAPHHLAAQAGARALRDGGSAVDAMVAAAAAIAVVYPHMNAIGGDGFWLIAEPGQAPFGIDAAGQSAALADHTYFATNHDGAVPSRGPGAALTVAGTIGGWAAALESSESRLPIARLLEDAIHYAENGMPITQGQVDLMHEKLGELANVPGYAETYLSDGGVPSAGAILKQPALAATMRRLAVAGLDDFYRGELAAANGAHLEAVGSPLRTSDLAAYRARRVEAFSTRTSSGTVYNMPPPTQGVSSLMILALFDRLGVRDAEGFAHIHGLVEATKQAFILRNAELTDPAFMRVDAETWLQEDALDGLAGNIDAERALPWPHIAKPGDTIWMGAVDAEGRAVSFIQSIFWEFGSGIVVPETGVLWQNRGHGFSMDTTHPNVVAPAKRPFHTLNPAMASLADGSVLTYGNMGGEGQPQTQSAVFSRYAMFGQTLQHAVTAPRWLLGRTWGEDSTTLKLESRFDPALIESLRAAGHNVDVVEPFTSIMGHAGAIARRANGVLEGATDPRSDGAVAAF